MSVNLAAVAKAQAELIREAQEIIARELDPEGDKTRAYDDLLALLDSPRERDIRRAYEQANK